MKFIKSLPLIAIFAALPLAAETVAEGMTAPAGDWSGSENRQRMLNGNAEDGILFWFRCDTAGGRIVAHRAKDHPEAEDAPMVLTTDTGEKVELEATSDDPGLPGYYGALAMDDPWVAAFGAASAVTVKVAGTPPLTLELNDEVRDHVTNCT